MRARSIAREVLATIGLILVALIISAAVIWLLVL